MKPNRIRSLNTRMKETSSPPPETAGGEEAASWGTREGQELHLQKYWPIKRRDVCGQGWWQILLSPEVSSLRRAVSHNHNGNKVYICDTFFLAGKENRDEETHVNSKPRESPWGLGTGWSSTVTQGQSSPVRVGQVKDRMADWPMTVLWTWPYSPLSLLSQFVSGQPYWREKGPTKSPQRL